MGEPSRLSKLRHWLGGWSFLLTCWLYELDPAQTYLEVDLPSAEELAQNG